jgi:hypothetical protein
VLVDHKIIFLPAELQIIWQILNLGQSQISHYIYTHFPAPIYPVNISWSDGDRDIQVTELQRVTSEGLKAAPKLSIQLKFRRC